MLAKVLPCFVATTEAAYVALRLGTRHVLGANARQVNVVTTLVILMLVVAVKVNNRPVGV